MKPFCKHCMHMFICDEFHIPIDSEVSALIQPQCQVVAGDSWEAREYLAKQSKIKEEETVF